MNYTTDLDRLSQARSAAWAAYNAAPQDSALLGAAVVAQRAYDAWWKTYCQANRNDTRKEATR